MSSLSSLKGIKKVHNKKPNKAAKIGIRRIALQEIPDASVFDAFAGPGAMFRAVWKEAKDYTGCDTRWYADDRSVFVADNRPALKALDLSRFNVFDLDAFGSPWEQAEIIANKRKVRPGEKIALVLTEGLGITMAGGALPKAMARIAGVTGKQSGLLASKDEIEQRAIQGLAKMMRADVLRIARASQPSGTRMTYSVVILRGQSN